ncbi:MAG: hypothetical protein ACUVS7_15970 [Bryobacteraceae bacterium]
MREEVWFKLPLAIPACENANPRLTWMSPLAAASGTICACLPVHRHLAQNAELLLPLWAGWHPHLAKRTRLFADAVRPDMPQPEASVSFNGGVDGRFTVFRRPGSWYYVNAPGPDIPLSK